MAEDDFEIDIYGDAAGDQSESKADDGRSNTYDHEDPHQANGDNGGDYQENSGDMDTHQNYEDDVTPSAEEPPHGVKRKVVDERPTDPGATTALLISELNWWHTDDDIRGWARQADCEDELKDITFSEHKVNGKSKGQAYVEFISQQGASATKHRIDEIGNESNAPSNKRQTVIYSSPTVNPFRTLPKDAPARAGGHHNKDGPGRTPAGPNNYNENNNNNRNFNNNMGGGNNYNGGFRGGRGGFGGPRGGMNQGGGGGFNRNFSGGNMNAFNNNNNNMGGGFNPMGGNNNFGFRGGMGGGMRGGPGGGMRGGRGGGMNGGGMMGGGMGPMGGMSGPMGLPGGMGMGMMGGGMPGKHSREQQYAHDSRGSYNHIQRGVYSKRLYDGLSAAMAGPARSSGAVGVGVGVGVGLAQPPLPVYQANQLGPFGFRPFPTGFQGMQPHFNPGFFGNVNSPNQDWQNPHGTKRPRGE